MSELSEVAQEWLEFLGEFRANNSGTAGWVMLGKADSLAWTGWVMIGKAGSLDWTMTDKDWEELERVCAEVKWHLRNLNDGIQ